VNGEIGVLLNLNLANSRLKKHYNNSNGGKIMKKRTKMLNAYQLFMILPSRLQAIRNTIPLL